jgi:hypothetical protein
MYIYYDYEGDDGGIGVGVVWADPADAAYEAVDRLSARRRGESAMTYTVHRIERTDEGGTP